MLVQRFYALDCVGILSLVGLLWTYHYSACLLTLLGSEEGSSLKAGLRVRGLLPTFTVTTTERKVLVDIEEVLSRYYANQVLRCCVGGESEVVTGNELR